MKSITKLHGKWTLLLNNTALQESNFSLHRPKRIIHLDVHPLFCQGVRDYCFLQMFPNISLKIFTHENEAYKFIKSEIDNQNPIDLLIADITPPGIMGDELVKKIREYERKMVAKRIPVILLTMIPRESLEHILGTGLNLVDKYLPKTATANEITKAVENILTPQSVLKLLNNH